MYKENMKINMKINNAVNISEKENIFFEFILFYYFYDLF